MRAAGYLTLLSAHLLVWKVHSVTSTSFLFFPFFRSQKVKSSGGHIIGQNVTTKEETKQPNGLKNLCNTCYFNSVIQSLYHSTVFRECILNSTYLPEGTVAGEIQQVFRDLNNKNAPADPSRLVRALGIDVRLQEDSEELYLNILNAIDKVFIHTSPVEYKNPSSVFEIGLLQYINCTDVIASRIRNEKHYDLSIGVDTKFKSVTDALDAHFEAEFLTGENRYKHKEFGYQNAMKGLNVSKFPKMLAIHLKRFTFDMISGDLTKVNHPLDIPLELDLKKYHASYHAEDRTAPGTLTKEGIYDLQSIIIHEGTLNRGHYYCLTKHPDSPNDWVELNDQMVIIRSFDQVREMAVGSRFSQRNAYLLFYKDRM